MLTYIKKYYDTCVLYDTDILYNTSGSKQHLIDYATTFSPHVEVMAPIMYMFPDGYFSMVALSNSCFSPDEDGITTAFIVEENSDTGEHAYFARKIQVILGRSDDKCSEIIKSTTVNAIFICSTDRKITDGDRLLEM